MCQELGIYGPALPVLAQARVHAQHKHSERRWSLQVCTAVPGKANELSNTKALVFSEVKAASPQPEAWPRSECTGKDLRK